MRKDDFTASGLKLEGQWENDRNAESRDLFTAIIKEAFGTDQTIVAHHLVYTTGDNGYFIVEEIPSADALIFDHSVMRKIFGEESFKSVLTQLACEPCETCDAKLRELYEARSK